MTNSFSEDILVEQPAIALFETLGGEPVHSKDLYAKKCDTVYQHVYDSYYGGGRSVYATGMVM